MFPRRSRITRCTPSRFKKTPLREARLTSFNRSGPHLWTRKDSPITRIRSGFSINRQGRPRASLTATDSPGPARTPHRNTKKQAKPSGHRGHPRDISSLHLRIRSLFTIMSAVPQTVPTPQVSIGKDSFHQLPIRCSIIAFVTLPEPRGAPAQMTMISSFDTRSWLRSVVSTSRIMSVKVSTMGIL